MVMLRHLSASVEYRPVDEIVVPKVTGSVQLPTVAWAGVIRDVAASAAVPRANKPIVYFILVSSQAAR